MKQKIQLKYLLFGICILGFFGACNNHKAIWLRLQLAKNKTYHYTIKNNQLVSAPGANMTQETTLEVSYQKLKDSSNAIRATINRVAFQISAPGINSVYDSKDGAGLPSAHSPLSPVLQLINRSFILQLNEEGKIEQITSSPNKNTPRQNDSVINQILAQSFDFYPNQAVKPGDTWTATTQIPVQGLHTTLKTTYTLKKIRKDTALLMSQAILDAPEKTLILNHTKMKVTLSGHQNGLIKIYIPDGHLLSATFTSNITGIFHAQGQELKSTTKGTSTITSEKE